MFVIIVSFVSSSPSPFEQEEKYEEKKKNKEGIKETENDVREDLCSVVSFFTVILFYF
jgi:hypothetical protein